MDRIMRAAKTFRRWQDTMRTFIVFGVIWAVAGSAQAQTEDLKVSSTTHLVSRIDVKDLGRKPCALAISAPTARPTSCSCRACVARGRSRALRLPPSLARSFGKQKAPPARMGVSTAICPCRSTTGTTTARTRCCMSAKTGEGVDAFCAFLLLEADRARAAGSVNQALSDD